MAVNQAPYGLRGFESLPMHHFYFMEKPPFSIEETPEKPSNIEFPEHRREILEEGQKELTNFLTSSRANPGKSLRQFLTAGISFLFLMSASPGGVGQKAARESTEHPSTFGEVIPKSEVPAVIKRLIASGGEVMSELIAAWPGAPEKIQKEERPTSSEEKLEEIPTITNWYGHEIDNALFVAERDESGVEYYVPFRNSEPEKYERWKKALDKLQQATVMVGDAEEPRASGFIIKHEGKKYVLTNLHVAEALKGSKGFVRLANNKTLPTEVLRETLPNFSGQYIDLALLSLPEDESQDLPYLTLASREATPEDILATSGYTLGVPFAVNIIRSMGRSPEPRIAARRAGRADVFVGDYSLRAFELFHNPISRFLEGLFETYQKGVTDYGSSGSPVIILETPDEKGEIGKVVGIVNTGSYKKWVPRDEEIRQEYGVQESVRVYERRSRHPVSVGDMIGSETIKKFLAK